MLVLRHRDQQKESARFRMNNLGPLETVWRDLRYTLKTMRKNPVFVTTAVLTLALGIAGNTTMFTVIRAVLLKPLEYQNPDRLVRLSAAPLRHDSRK
jgi:hypothetical protein